jgi:5-methylcytosine-specific restriction protein A
MTSTPASIAMAGLRPTSHVKVIDVVADTGIDVSGWKTKADGTPVANPALNPNFCYEWGFGGDGEPILLCVWHRSLSEIDGHVVYRDNLRALAMKLESITFDRFAPKDARHRAKDQARRARRFDEFVQQAFRRRRPVRLVLLEGEQADASELGRDSSKVRFRRLDETEWHVSSYSDENGEFTIVRGGMPASVEPEDEPSPEFADQFSIEGPERREISTSAFVRSADVRRAVLCRAAGRCELCGEIGFTTVSGAVYLETHHVLPLGEQGPDVVWNVVALCANDHRRLHFSAERIELRESLLDLLASTFPREIAELRSALGSTPRDSAAAPSAEQNG